MPKLKLDLVGVTEIAAMFGVNRVTAAKWRQHGLLPEPDAMLPKRPLWFRETIVAWGKETGRQVA
jgi:hypothetical protein